MSTTTTLHPRTRSLVAAGVLAAAVAACATPASALNTDPVLLGLTNSSYNATIIHSGSQWEPAMSLDNLGIPGSLVHLGGSNGVEAHSPTDALGAGVAGFGRGDHVGVRGESATGIGVSGTGASGVVAYGTSNGIRATGDEVGASASGGLVGVRADGDRGIEATGSLFGVSATSDSVGVLAIGKEAAVRAVGSGTGRALETLGPTSLNGPTNVSGAMTVAGPATVTGAATVNGAAAIGGAATVTGTATFKNTATFQGKIAAPARSGILSIPAGSSGITRTGVSLTGTSLVMATLQTNTPGLYVQSAMPAPSTSAFTIVLSKAVPAGVTAKVAWLIVN